MTTQLHNSTLELRDRLTLMGVPLPLALKRRDPKEPGRKQKEATEDKIYKAFQRNFAKQKREIREVLLRIAPERKSLFGYDLDYYLSQFDDEFWRDEEFIAKLGRILVGATAGGIDIFADLMPLEIDYTLVNEEAARWASKYAGNLVGEIDKTTRKALRGTISDFVTTPGMTIGDIVGRLPYNESRSMMIAVTETTKTFAMGERMAGEALQKEYPDVLVIKTWFTNQDDIVCPLCRPLHMVEVPIKDTFPGGIEQPPLHCRCRCWMSTTTKIGGMEEEGERATTSKEWIASLTKEEESALWAWGRSDMSYGMRKIQRGDLSGLSKKEIELYTYHLRHWESAIAKGVRYEGEVYRGLSDVSKDTIDKWLNDGIIELTNDQSATYADDIIERFTGSGQGDRNSVAWTLDQSTGVNLFEKTSVTVGGNPVAEKEILLQKGAKYKVTSVEYIKDNGDIFDSDWYFEGTEYSWPDNPPPGTFGETGYTWHPGSDFAGRYLFRLAEILP